MSYEATSVLEKDDQINASGSFGSEITDDNWDKELTNIVGANADVVIKSPWHQGAEMTLSAAILAAPEINRANVHMFVSEVYRLLAARIAENEQPEDEEFPEETAEDEKGEEEQSAKMEEANQKINTKNEVQAAQENSKTVDGERQSKKEIDGTKHLELSVNMAEKTSGSEERNVLAVGAGVAANLIQGELKQSTQGIAKAEATATTGTPGELVVISNTSESSARKSITDETGQGFTPVESSAKDRLNETKPAIESEVEAKQQIPTFGIPETDGAANPTVEEMPAPVRHQLVADQEIKSLILPAAIEVLVEPEAIELGGEKIELTEEESVLATFDYQMGTNRLTDFIEEKDSLVDFEETGLEPDELYMFSDALTLEAGEDALISQLDNKTKLSGQMEITSPEKPAQINLTIEEIEDSLTELTERIETSEPETTEMVNEILDKIIAVPEKLEAGSSENIITEAEAQAELEELFTELFDKTGIDSTPELIESLAHLTLKSHLADKIEKLKNEEETDKAPQDRGTHEVIKKLLVSLNIIKKAVAHACAIGKSALALYTVNLAT